MQVFRCNACRYQFSDPRVPPKPRASGPDCPRCGGRGKLAGWHHRVRSVRRFLCADCKHSFYAERIPPPSGKPLQRPIYAQEDLREAAGLMRMVGTGMAVGEVRSLISISAADVEGMRQAGISAVHIDRAIAWRRKVRAAFERLLAESAEQGEL